MKKNITINLAGQLFAIDEDAYELLLNYTETLRRYYRRQEEGEEVVDDIEARIAELFAELLAQGNNAINIEHVQNIIQRIGRIEDITEGESSNSHASTDSFQSAAAGAADALGNAAQNAVDSARGAWNKVRSGKRFYRDAENKMVAGVLAGCSKYFGGDVVIWRVAFLLLLCLPITFFGDGFSLSGFIFWGYVVLAFITPATSTPEDVLKMRGEEVNPQNLAEEVTRQNAYNNANEARAQRRQTMNMIFAVLLILFSVWMWLGLLGVICGGGVLGFMPEFIRHEMFGGQISVQGYDADKVVFSILYILIAVGVCLFVMAYTALHTGLAILGKVKAMGLKERLVWLLVWALSVVGITIAGVNCASTVSQVEAKHADESVEVIDKTQPAPADSTATTANPDSAAATQPSDSNVVATPFQ